MPTGPAQSPPRWVTLALGSRWSNYLAPVRPMLEPHRSDESCLREKPCGQETFGTAECCRKLFLRGWSVSGLAADSGRGHNPMAGEAPPDPSKRRILTIVVVVLIVLAGSGVSAYWLLRPGGGAGSSPTSDLGNGVTFNTSFAAIESEMTGLPGGPWTLTSVSGVASALPIAPDPMVDYEANYSLNRTALFCGSLPGVTVWNMTGAPTFTGAPDSGAAPFWSMAFKNASGSIALATYIENSVRVYPPSPALEECARVSGLSQSDRIAPTIDTSEAAAVAFAKDASSIARVESPFVEYYVFGAPQQVDVDSGPQWILNFFRCDMAGIAGVQNYTAIGVTPNGSVYLVDAGFLTCTSPTGYTLIPGASSVTSFGVNASSTDISIPIQVTFLVGANDTRFFDGWGLQPWMINLTLTNSTSKRIPEATPTCLDWVVSIQDCPASPAGWFAVLTSANGTWLDTFPSSPSSNSWAFPNALVVSHERLVIVVPSSWNLSGDTLSATSSDSKVPVTLVSPL